MSYREASNEVYYEVTRQDKKTARKMQRILTRPISLTYVYSSSLNRYTGSRRMKKKLLKARKNDR